MAQLTGDRSHMVSCQQQLASSCSNHGLFTEGASRGLCAFGCRPFLQLNNVYTVTARCGTWQSHSMCCGLCLSDTYICFDAHSVCEQLAA